MELRFNLQLVNRKKRKKSAKIKKVYQGNIIATLFFVFFETLRLVWDEIKNEPVFEFPEIPKHIKKRLNRKVRIDKKHYKTAFLALSIGAMSFYLSGNPYVLAVLEDNAVESHEARINPPIIQIRSAQAKEEIAGEIALEENTLPDNKKAGELIPRDEYCGKDKDQKRSSNYCGVDQTEEGIENIVIEPKKVVPVKKAAPRPPPKISCHKEDDNPGKSDTKGKHMDEDCCPDPDEWPKPGCVYSQGGRVLMLKGPK